MRAHLDQLDPELSCSQQFTVVPRVPAFVQRPVQSWLWCDKVTALKSHFLQAAGFIWSPVSSKANGSCCFRLLCPLMIFFASLFRGQM